MKRFLFLMAGISALILGFAMVVGGVVFVFGSFFFDAVSDWPRNVSMAIGGVLLLSAATHVWRFSLVMLERSVPSAW
jgi:hypothetical protein